jgi:two-component system nitrate/nitrite response regulator NarL
MRPLLESDPEFTVIGDTSDGSRFIKMASELKPDVLLFELHLRKCSGTELLKQIATLDSGICPIILTDKIEKDEVLEALRWGIRGILWKQESQELMFRGIRTAMSGEYWVSRSFIHFLVEHLRTLSAKVEQGTQLRTDSLSPQQQHIVDSIASGCSNKEIAKELLISERTVKYHLTRIFSKLGVTDRMQLARFTIRNS